MNKATEKIKPQREDTVQRKLEYQPPDETVFEELAERFCDEMSRRGGLAASVEVVVGLAEFLTTVARLTAKSLNKSNTNPHAKPIRK